MQGTMFSFPAAAFFKLARHTETFAESRLARKEFKFARKCDKRLSLSKIMLSPGLTDFWNKTLE